MSGIDQGDGGFTVLSGGRGLLRARRLVLAGGVWLERMLAWLGLQVPVKCLINQLVVTERLRPVMRRRTS